MSVKIGDKVKIEYTGTFEDGTVFDSSEKHGHPLEFEVGSGQVVKGFDQAVIGMQKDEKKEVKIMPKDGYGEHNSELIRDFPKDQIPNAEKAEVGHILMVQTADGQQFPATITKVDDSSITIDLNHPLAGKTLMFKLKVVDITPIN